ncbi:MAG: helix-turn-helix domain-containing protein [Patescibacteria group bacterium]
MNDKIKKALQEIGLSANEAKLFLATLQLGASNISQLAKAAKIKRPTAYLACESLLTKKMLLVDKKNPSRPVYKASDPQNILNDIRKKEEIFTSIFPELRRVSKQELLPHVQIAVDYEDIINLYRELLDHSAKKEVMIYGTISPEGNEEIHSKLLKYWMRMLKVKPVKIREILTYTDQNLNYVRQVEKNGNKNHRIKVIPETFQYLPYRMKILDGDNFIYDNKVVSFSSYKESFYALVIHHAHIYNIYRDLFEMAWEMAEEG